MAYRLASSLSAFLKKPSRALATKSNSICMTRCIHHGRRPSSIPISRHRVSSTRSFSLLRPRFRGQEWTWRDLSVHIVKHEPLILTALLLSLSLISYGSYRQYKRRQLARGLGSFPPRVGIALDRALYFTYNDVDVDKAMSAFVEALKAAAEEGIDALSDEVIGVRVELAKSLQVHKNPESAIQILQDIKSNCLSWIKDHEYDPETSSRRNKLLAWACRISTRLADLYADPNIQDHAKVEECLVWAVETTLKERHRRQQHGVSPGADNWLDDDEVGSQLEDTAHMFEQKNNHYYASQLFLAALSLKTTTDCHSVILMNNVATSLAQQRPASEPGTPPTSRAQLRDSGKSWALQALILSQKIKPPERSDECDIGCVVATHNLGEFAEMEGNIAEARERYEQAASLAHAYQFDQGLASANQGLKRLRM